MFAVLQVSIFDLDCRPARERPDLRLREVGLLFSEPRFLPDSLTETLPTLLQTTAGLLECEWVSVISWYLFNSLHDEAKLPYCQISFQVHHWSTVFRLPQPVPSEGANSYV